MYTVQYSNPRVLCGENPPDILTPVYKRFGGFIVPVCYEPSLENTLPATRVFFNIYLGVSLANSFLRSCIVQISFKSEEFSGHIFPTVKGKNLFQKHLLLKIKFLYLRNSYICPIWIFIFDTDRAQIYRVLRRSHGSEKTLPN